MLASYPLRGIKKLSFQECYGLQVKILFKEDIAIVEENILQMKSIQYLKH
ncbi:hypothetical protein JM83_2688 [Gillisia sp. Hel_I_86]|nr:hypothetical protein JM83_2688 [Gillisia sp. Hel_I_86]